MSLDPITLLALAGAASSAVGAISQGNAAKKAGQYNAAVARNNAVAATQAAAENEKRQRRLGTKRMGAMRARGASLDLLEDSAMEEELAALDERFKGVTQAAGFEATAGMELAKGAAAQRAGYFSAASSVLLGGSKAFGSSGSPSGFVSKSNTYGSRSLAGSLSPGQGIYE